MSDRDLHARWARIYRRFFLIAIDVIFVGAAITLTVASIGTWNTDLTAAVVMAIGAVSIWLTVGRERFITTRDAWDNYALNLDTVREMKRDSVHDCNDHE